jgi:hypothetical protein
VQNGGDIGVGAERGWQIGTAEKVNELGVVGASNPHAVFFV